MSPMSLSPEAFKNGWGYKLDLENNCAGFLLFFPKEKDVTEVKRLGFTLTKFSHKNYKMWVIKAKGRKIMEVIGFFRRHNLPLLTEEEIGNLFPFKLD